MRNKRLLSTVFVILLIVCLLCSCAETGEIDGTPSYALNRFKTVYVSLRVVIIVDTVTKVQYFYTETGYGGGVCVLVDESGLPLIYEGE